MKKFIFTLFLLSILGAIASAIYFEFHQAPKEDHLTLFGNVDVRLVNIGFRVPGRVAELHFEEGDFVPKASLMAILDKSPYNSQISQAEANVEAAGVAYKNAEILLKRRQEAVLVGGVTQEDVDNAQASRDQLFANLEAARAAKAVAIDNLNYTEAYAPTDGIILSRIREPGTVVNPADPVYSLSVNSPIWIRAYATEPDLGKIYYGMEGDVYTDSGQKYKGKIGFISPVAEFTPKTVETTQLRTDLVYRLRLYVDNPDHFLKQGMPVTVKLPIKGEI